MQIAEGLFDHMVLQRNARNVSEARFSGTCAGNGALKVSIRKGKRPLKSFIDLALGRTSRGRFRACLKGLPAGGPYEVNLCVSTADGSVRDKLRIKDVLVGDVWLLGGQSNMQGVGLLKDASKPHPLVRAFYMDDRWAPAKDPIHNMWDCVDQVHIDLSGGIRPGKATDWGVGPGVSFGQQMLKLTGIPQGMIASGHGGTSMEQWNPELKQLGGKSLYGAMMRRFKKNGSSVAGLVWYQGESDSGPEVTPRYTKRMKEFIATLRRDCGDRSLPVALVQIGRVADAGPEGYATWNSIQDQQRKLPGSVKRCTVVPAVDLALDDTVHICGIGQRRLGIRLANAMNGLISGKTLGKPITVKRITVEDPRGLGNVIVEFSNVVGKLRAASRPTGFYVSTSGSNRNIFDVQLKGRCAIIRTIVAKKTLGNGSLHYGYGTDPYCNITDEADRSLPVFGPVCPISPQAVTPSIRTMRVSAFQPSAGKLESLECPADTSVLGLETRTFPTDFCNMRPEIAQHGNSDNVLYYVCKLECSEAMKLLLYLGYDGPLKVWVDRKEVFRDPKGTNPALPVNGKAPVEVEQGGHEMIIALGTNHGAAWGVYLSIERTDVPKRLVRLGQDHYSMPKILG